MILKGLLVSGFVALVFSQPVSAQSFSAGECGSLFAVRLSR
jgi:hypothetical protein